MNLMLILLSEIGLVNQSLISTNAWVENRDTILVGSL